MRRTLWILGFLALPAGPAVAAETLNPPMDFPQVGLKIALPAGLERHISQSVQLLYLGWGVQEKHRVGAAVYATVSDKPFEQSLDRSLSQTMAASVPEGTNLKSAAPRKLGLGDDRSAWQSPLVLPGKPDAMSVVMTAWDTDFPDAKLHCRYVLEVRRTGDDLAAARALADASAKSARKIPMKDVWQMPLPPINVPLGQQKEHAFQIKLPEGWTVNGASNTPAGYALTLVAPSFRSQSAVVLAFEARRMPEDKPVPDLATDAGRKTLTAIETQDLNREKAKLLSSRAVPFGGQPGMEFKASGGESVSLILRAFGCGHGYTLLLTGPPAAKEYLDLVAEAVGKTFTIAAPR